MNNFGFMPGHAARVGGGLENERILGKQRGRARRAQRLSELSGQDVPMQPLARGEAVPFATGPGGGSGLSRQYGPSRPGEVRRLMHSAAGEVPPGGGVTGFMPMGPQPHQGMGLDAEAVGASFDDLPELKEDVIQKAMEDPKNRNEDGSFKWHIILGSLAAGIAAAVTGGGLSGALQAGIATAGGGFKGLLAAEETKAKQAKLQAATNKMFTDRKLEHYKKMYQMQVDAGDYLGAAKTLKISNRLTGSPIPEIDVDDWARGRRMQDDMKEVGAILETMTDQATAGIKKGFDPSDAWKDFELTEAMVYKINGLNPNEDKLTMRHWDKAASVIGEMAEKKVAGAKESFQKYLFESRGRQKLTMQGAIHRITQRAGQKYDNDEDGGSNIFTTNQYNAGMNDTDKLRHMQITQAGADGWNVEKFEGYILEALDHDIKSGELQRAVSEMRDLGQGDMSEERMVEEIMYGYSDAAKKKARGFLKKKAREARGQREPLKTEFDRGFGVRDVDAAGKVGAGMVLEAAINSIKNLKAGDFTLEDTTPESIIAQLAEDPNFADVLADKRTFDMAVEGLKDAGGNSMIPRIREMAGLTYKDEIEALPVDRFASETRDKAGKIIEPRGDLAGTRERAEARQALSDLGEPGPFDKIVDRLMFAAASPSEEAAMKKRTADRVARIAAAVAGAKVKGGALATEPYGGAIPERIQRQPRQPGAGRREPTPSQPEPVGHTGVRGEFGRMEEGSAQPAAQQQQAGNVPQRNNNPGNVKSGGLADQFAMKNEDGTVMTDGPPDFHLVFATSEDGMKAVTADLDAKIRGDSPATQRVLGKPNAETLDELSQVYLAGETVEAQNAWRDGVRSILQQDHAVGGNAPLDGIPMEFLVKAIAKQEGFFS